jgi:hypothetical protein
MSTPSELASALSGLHAVCTRILRVVEQEHAACRQGGRRGPADLAEGPADLAQAPADLPWGPAELGKRKNFLAELTDSLDKIRECRMAWLRRDPSARHSSPETTELLRATQNLIMRILMLDRENEQALLRKGLIPARPATTAPTGVRHRFERGMQPPEDQAKGTTKATEKGTTAPTRGEVPREERPRPHFVSSLYQRNSAT